MFDTGLSTWGRQDKSNAASAFLSRDGADYSVSLAPPKTQAVDVFEKAAVARWLLFSLCNWQCSDCAKWLPFFKE
jgi:hypothetical protein